MNKNSYFDEPNDEVGETEDQRLERESAQAEAHFDRERDRQAEREWEAVDRYECNLEGRW